MLYPVQTKSRIVSSLDGMWDFILGDGNNFDEGLVGKRLVDSKPMPVPSSYNDIYEDSYLRDHFGWVYYQRQFDVSASLTEDRLILRFDAVTHFAKIYINGEFVGEHKGGFLPFEIDVTDKVKDCHNLLTVAVNNVINYETLPIGGLGGSMMDALMGGGGAVNLDEEYIQTKNTPNFDFFNYAGITRHVRLYTTPKNYIADITMTNDEVSDNHATLGYKLDVCGEGEAKVFVYDEEGNCVAEAEGLEGKLEIKDVKLWWPLNAYLYEIVAQFGEDEYHLPYGIRTVRVDGMKFLINEKPFYFKGYGKHEDTFPNGRGMNEVMYYKDLGLMKWQGANSFRTAHYPYSEEMMRLADRMGFVVIDETPAVGINGMFGGGANFGGQPVPTFGHQESIGTKVFDHHKEVIRDWVARDKNYACVCIWSVANEPDSSSEGAYEYFEPLFNLTRELDPQKRPVTLVSVQMGGGPLADVSSKLSDIICINRYYGWYFGGPDLVGPMEAFRAELKIWQEEVGKPVIISEYGADAVLGMRDSSENPVLYTEDYQVKYYVANNAVMDEFRCVVGEHPWNFADFATDQNLLRVQGNKKGLFSRERRPKLAAYYFKDRWNAIPHFDWEVKNK